MVTKSRVSIVGCAAVSAVLACSVFAPPAGAQTQGGATRTVFASVVMKDGTPVTDLTVEDFEVREGGKVQPIVSAKLSTMPLRVHIIVEDAGTGAFQLGTLRLLQALASRSEFALTSVMVQGTRILDFTDNVQLIGEAIQQLGRRGTITGGNQLMEAIISALDDIAAPGKHAVLVVLRMGNEEPSTMPATAVREVLRKSRATMYVVSRTGASKAAATYAGGAATNGEAAQRQMGDSEVADSALQLNLVLGDGPRDSGGTQQETALTTAVPTLQQVAGEIANQYEITYTASAAKPGDKLQVTTKRKNATAHAPAKIAN
jgi:VWFA-related protein